MVLGMGAIIPAMAQQPVRNNESEEEELGEDMPCKVPPYLQPGDTIGITCPAGYITYDQILPAIRIMESWGYKILIGKTVGARDFTFGGTDAERLADLQAMLDNPKVQAIMCARGGYGVARIVDGLQFDKFKQHPKWVIGFSDITVLHAHIQRNCHVASIHSKMCNSFPDEFKTADPIVQQTILSIRQALSGEKMTYTVELDPKNRLGTANGELIGGNLAMLQSIAATKSDIQTAGKILFLEDTGEYLYSIDRMLGNLARAGKLAKLNGLIMGGFTKIKADDPGEEFGKSVYDIVLEKVKDYKYPVCFNFPVGHIRNNFALKCGVKHRLRVDASGVSFAEI